MMDEFVRHLEGWLSFFRGTFVVLGAGTIGALKTEETKWFIIGSILFIINVTVVLILEMKIYKIIRR